jgi:hypothetical protein
MSLKLVDHYTVIYLEHTECPICHQRECVCISTEPAIPTSDYAFFDLGLQPERKWRPHYADWPAVASVAVTLLILGAAAAVLFVLSQK